MQARKARNMSHMSLCLGQKPSKELPGFWICLQSLHLQATATSISRCATRFIRGPHRVEGLEARQLLVTAPRLASDSASPWAQASISPIALSAFAKSSASDRASPERPFGCVSPTWSRDVSTFSQPQAHEPAKESCERSICGSVKVKLLPKSSIV